MQEELAAAQSELTSDTREQDQFLREKIELDRQAQVAALQEQARRHEIGQSELGARVKLVDAIADARLDLVNRNEAIRFAGEQLDAAVTALGALVIALGNGRVVGYHEDARGAVVMQPEQYETAWRVLG